MVSVLGFELHGLHDGLTHFQRDVRVELVRRRHPLHRTGGDIHWALTRQQEIEHAAHGVNVGVIAFLARRRILLDGSITQGKDGGMTLHLIVYKLTRRSKVNQHNAVIRCDNDIVGFNVAMQHMLAMNVSHSLTQLPHAVDGIIVTHLAVTLDELLQCGAFHIFHDNIRGVVFIEDVVHPNHVRMVQGSQSTGLVCKARLQLIIHQGIHLLQ